MKSRHVLFSAATLMLVGASVLSAATAISNLNDTFTDHYVVTSSQRVAAGFTTGASDYTLEGIAILLRASNNSSPLTLSLYGDDSGEPANLLGSFSGNASPSAAGTYSYSISLGLAANTTYWVVASVASGGGQYDWNLSFEDTPVWDEGFEDWYFEDTLHKTGSGSWNNLVIDNNTRMKMSVSATAVPEPSSVVLLALGGIAIFRRRRRRC